MSLGDERLSTTDNKGSRIFLYPAEVKGVFRKYRNILQIFLILFFLILPWIKWNGTQLFLFDIPNRTFHLFGILFKAHDAPLIFLFLALATVSLAFITAIYGRVWCGWACPQTVFIDGVYRRIETWIQGSYLQRRKLAQSTWTKEKVCKVSLTWILFFLVSTIISHSFVAYFVGSDRLLAMLQGTPQENWTAFIIVMSMTLVLMFDFGWFREQFCIIACPYGRIQSVLMDKKSMSVLYDYKRGEPRKDAGVPKSEQGDCVSCKRCVEVCPTGIDIRRGIQLECIGCTACIDACDDIMKKVSKPVGLIRYSSEFEIENKVQVTAKQRFFNPRVLIYFLVIGLLIGVLLFQIQLRDPVLVSVLKTKDAPYSLITENSQELVLNHFKLHVHNQSLTSLRVNLKSFEDLDLVVPRNNISLKSNSSVEIHFFVKFPLALSKKFNGSFKRPLIVEVEQKDRSFIINKELTFVGPL